jgi:hypothetical protein
LCAVCLLRRCSIHGHFVAALERRLPISIEQTGLGPGPLCPPRRPPAPVDGSTSETFLVMIAALPGEGPWGHWFPNTPPGEVPPRQCTHCFSRCLVGPLTQQRPVPIISVTLPVEAPSPPEPFVSRWCHGEALWIQPISLGDLLPPCCPWPAPAAAPNATLCPGEAPRGAALAR